MDMVQKVQKIANDIRLEVTKRDIMLEDKVKEIQYVKESIFDKIEILNLTLKDSLDKDATKALERLDLKYKSEIESYKTRIFQLESYLKNL